MNIGEILLIALALSLDAFSAALSCGMKLPRNSYRSAGKISLAFGTFQGVMPLLGHYFSSTLLHQWIESYAAWAQAGVFALLAAKTFSDYLQDQARPHPCSCHCQNPRCLATLALATSIDAFLIGAVLGLDHRNLFVAVVIIGVVTCLNSAIGVLLGNLTLQFRGPLQTRAKLLAGSLLLFLAASALINQN